MRVDSSAPFAVVVVKARAKQEKMQSYICKLFALHRTASAVHKGVIMKSSTKVTCVSRNDMCQGGLSPDDATQMSDTSESSSTSEDEAGVCIVLLFHGVAACSSFLLL